MAVDITQEKTKQFYQSMCSLIIDFDHRLIVFLPINYDEELKCHLYSHYNAYKMHAYNDGYMKWVHYGKCTGNLNFEHKIQKKRNLKSKCLSVKKAMWNRNKRNLLSYTMRWGT